ncbi:aminotransferase class V-fold PLP-dependent enzyme [Microscilla marina]|uniref:NifS protein, putative n=1 Tax=Microscilla marina ATCC 23134 TaxID=313606 RepID=A1ZLN1_MICM2|nr:aminotransferase class V-fold PLP-dependent enzyme [Microscilla marina]EAY28785.1 NifS protein, putative [Microscilla marina ATCC 23134]
MNSFIHKVYLDTAGVSRLLPQAAHAMQTTIMAQQYQGKAGIKQEAARLIPSLRHQVATLLGCHPHETAITDNTTHGVNIVAQGIQWRKGDCILIPDNEFPSNVYPWLNLVAQGVEIVRIPTQQGKYTVEDIAKAITPKTRLVALSHVGYLSGFRADINAIGELCAQQGILFFVDAAQSAGLLNIDVKKAKVSALTTCSWKWLRGPVGAGFLYCSEELMPQLKPAYVGAGAMQQSESDPATLPFDFKPGAARFEYSSLNISSIAGVHAAIKHLNQVSTQKIEAKAYADISFLFGALRNAGCTMYTGQQPPEKTQTAGILSFKHPEIPTATIEQFLDQHDIAYAHWHGYTRLSPAYDTPQAALEQFVHILNHLLILA